MLNFDFLEKIFVILLDILGVGLGIWVYLTNRTSRLNQWFMFMCFSTVLWVNFAFLGSNATSVKLSALFYRLNWGAVALFLISSFYFYVIHFLGQLKNHRVFQGIVLGLGIFFVVSSIFTGFIIKNIIMRNWGVEIVFGWLNNFFNGYALLVALLVVGFLIKQYFVSDRAQKLKIQYISIGTALFALFNIIFNIIVPSFTQSTLYQLNLGDYSVVFLIVFATYAIVKRNLFGIKTLLTDLLVGAMAIVLFVISFFADNLGMRIFLLFFFLFFCWFGFVLIRYTHREIKQKEILEKMVADRTKGLQKAFDELKISKGELERFYHLTVGRELRMIELKQKNKELEGNPNEYVKKKV